MGGSPCLIIIQAKLKELFSDPNIYAEVEEVPYWKRIVDYLLAKDYSEWTDHDFILGHSVYAQLYVKIKKEYS